MTDAKRNLYYELLALSERETIRQLDTALGRFVEEASTKGVQGPVHRTVPNERHGCIFWCSL